MAATVNKRRHRITGLSFDLQGDVSVRQELAQLGGRLPWLQERAIVTLQRRLPVEARRDIQAEYNISASRVRDHLRATTFTGDSARIAGVRLTGQWKRGIGLMNFSARPTRKGVTYSVYRGNRQLEPSAFIARLLGGNTHVVQRFGAKREATQGRYKGKQRQPLVVLYRSTVAQMLAKGRRPERLLDYSRNLVREEIERQLRSYGY
jgi:hypothetical protein